MQAYGICVCRILTLGTWGKKCTSMWLTQRTTVALFLITQFSVVRSQAYKSEHPVTALYEVCTTSTSFTYSYLILCNTWCLFFFPLCREQSHRFVYSEASPVAQWRNTVSLLFLLASFAIWLQWSNPHLQFVYCGYGTPGEIASFGRKPAWMMSIWWFFSRVWWLIWLASSDLNATPKRGRDAEGWGNNFFPLDKCR